MFPLFRERTHALSHDQISSWWLTEERRVLDFCALMVCSNTHWYTPQCTKPNHKQVITASTCEQMGKVPTVQGLCQKKYKCNSSIFLGLPLLIVLPDNKHQPGIYVSHLSGFLCWFYYIFRARMLINMAYISYSKLNERYICIARVSFQ